MRQEDFETAMRGHFEDDKKNFAELRQKTDKLSEQMTINGEHFSHFSKNLVEVNTHLSIIKQDIKDIKSHFSEEIEATNDRVEGLEDDKLIKDTKASTFMWVFGGTFTIIVSIAGYAYYNDLSYQKQSIQELKEMVQRLK